MRPVSSPQILVHHPTPSEQFSLPHKGALRYFCLLQSFNIIFLLTPQNSFPFHFLRFGAVHWSFFYIAQICFKSMNIFFFFWQAQWVEQGALTCYWGMAVNPRVSAHSCRALTSFCPLQWCEERGLLGHPSLQYSRTSSKCKTSHSESSSPEV